jgi:aspartate-semialdehyde dehydrogenase
MSGQIIAVLGATGAVGREILTCLEDRDLDIKEIRLLASKNSAGTEVEFRGKNYEVKEVHPDHFKGVTIAFFAAGGSTSKEYAPIAIEAGAIVIDKSSHFRMDKNTPLVVPEVNSAVLREYLTKITPKKGGLIASPNCSTIQLVVVLKPIADQFGLKRVVLSTYQSVSGAGQKGIDELSSQVISLFSHGEVEVKNMPYQIAFNCIPQIDSFLPNGYTKEEIKVIEESRKIMSLPDLKITATAVRVPTFACHGESVNIETDRSVDPKSVQVLLRGSPGVVVYDNPDKQEYPLGVDVVGTDATYVGRIRRDESLTNGINLWIVADNLRKGAALNAVQIAEIIAHERGLH